VNSLSYVTIVWSVTGSMTALLGLIHFARWTMDRRAWADLVFAAIAISFVGIALCELQMMRSGTPQELETWLRWTQLPIYTATVSTVVFVWYYFGTSRAWLAVTVVALRTVVLVVNFAVPPNINFANIESIRTIEFLDEAVTIVGEAVTGRWQFLATLESFLFTLFVVDAAATLWRRGGEDDRRRAAVIGGGIFLTIGIATLLAQLVIWRVIELPFLITLSFAATVCAIAYELSRDTMRASRLAQELHDIRRRLELAASAANLGLLEWDSRTNRVWATREARMIFGVSDEESDKYDAWLASIHPDDAARVTSTMQAALEAGGEYSLEFRIQPPGRAIRWVAAIGRAEAARPGSAPLIRGVVNDVSERRRAFNETQELRRELTHAGRVSMLGQLASSLAHELSQPLGAILRNAEAADMMLRRPSPDFEELKAIVADIQRDDRRAGEVIDRLRALLKRRQMDLQPVVPEVLLQDATSLVKGDAVSRHVTIECATDPDLPSIAGDRVHLSQVLINLIINGMDAVMERAPAHRKIILNGRRVNGANLELTVQDSGPGIPVDRIQRIFEPFFTTKDSGMGMGLAVSRTIVEAHGGQLTVENTPYGGALFRIRLPARPGIPA
jgi:two-component system, LuxR family, sensor kinase FixL